MFYMYVYGILYKRNIHVVLIMQETILIRIRQILDYDLLLHSFFQILIYTRGQDTN